MKKILYLVAFASLFLFSGCDFDDHHHEDGHNKVLMLKVDYNTFALEGGIEYSYEQETDSFNIDVAYIDTSDIATIKLTYKELNKTLFYGSLIWNGMGEVFFPETLDDPDEFETVLTDDVVFPSKGFIPIFNPINLSIDYMNLWMSVQNLEKVREFLQLNPDQKVKIFIYAPDYYNDPNNWDYYILIHN
jgi:hypothetical protein